MGVRVSFSSPVHKRYLLSISYAQVAELVDAHVSGACAERREGSSPFLGTKIASHCFVVAELSCK